MVWAECSISLSYLLFIAKTGFQKRERKKERMEEMNRKKDNLIKIKEKVDVGVIRNNVNSLLKRFFSVLLCV